MRRAFSPRQRKILRLLAGNRCSTCGEVLNNSFHADHIKAYTNGGATTLQNGQALCPSCNLKKGAADE